MLMTYKHTSTCRAVDAVASVGLMCRAIDALSGWMASNRLLLNPSKTQFIWLGSRRQLAGVDMQLLAETYPHVTFSLIVRDLGATLDQELSFSQHVNLLTRSCYYQLRQLRVVLRSLSHDAAVVLVHAFVTSRVDNCSSILAGLPSGLINRLDRVLRTATRLIGRIPKYASVSAYMRDVLHWLPASQRISYRIAALVWRCLAGCAPSYLSDLCRPVSDLAPPRRALRSSAKGELLVPRARLCLKQRRAFSVVGPSTWNGLPLELRLMPRSNLPAYCRLLKSSLFSRGWAGSASE